MMDRSAHLHEMVRVDQINVPTRREEPMDVRNPEARQGLVRRGVISADAGDARRGNRALWTAR